MKITISGRILAWDAETKQPLPLDRLKELDGLLYDQDVCSNYVDNDLLDTGILGGTLRIVYAGENDGLRIVTEYSAPQKLTDAQLAKLAADTQGQWSDGIGEGCFDDYQRESGVTIDL